MAIQTAEQRTALQHKPRMEMSKNDQSQNNVAKCKDDLYTVYVSCLVLRQYPTNLVVFGDVAQLRPAESVEEVVPEKKYH